MNIHDLAYIETPRLLIRPIKIGDEVELYAAIQHSLASIQRWMSWANNPSLETTTAFVKHAEACWHSDKAVEFTMVAIHKATNKIISASGFNEHSDPAMHVYEIGYWIDTHYAGRGFVTEIVNALTRYALEGLKAQRVQIRTQINNEKSIAVAKRCGYSFEAQLKNDRLDCRSGLPADGVLFACSNSSHLPPLDVTWKQRH